MCYLEYNACYLEYNVCYLESNACYLEYNVCYLEYIVVLPRVHRRFTSSKSPFYLESNGVFLKNRNGACAIG